MITELEIISRYLGIPFKHQGRTLDGLDCWGLIKLVYADLGFDLWDPVQDYDERWYSSNNHFIENYHREWMQVQEPKFLDGILFHDGFGRINHAGLFLSGGRFIHCCKAGVVIGKLSDPVWKDKFVGFYRFRKMVAK